MKRPPLVPIIATCLCEWLLGVPAFASAPVRTTVNATSDLALQVTIRRDKFGVPHILAPTEEAAAFGMGYATAEDHILVLGRLFVRARGEEARYFGEEFAQADLLLKQLHIYAGAESGYAQAPPWVQGILDGYAAGYNHYVAQHRAGLPEWIKPVSAVDVLAHGRRTVLMLFSMDLEQLKRIGQQALLPGLPADALARGSNMWAIGRPRSASGRGLLLGNPHLPWSEEFLFYEAHITVPGHVNTYGTTLIGSPVITIGFNEQLGWSHTVNLHDSDDVYELTLDPHDPHLYLYDGKSLPLRREELSIQVKTDGGLETRRQESYWSHYGPVLKVAGGKAYAFKSANQDETRMLEQWSLMGKARSLDEFRRVLDMQALPMFNICYADRGGTVFYLFNGRFPDRPAGYHWEGVVPGNTSATEWNHVFPQARLPQLLNPPNGYVQNCNSAPWYTNAQTAIDRRRYPENLTPNFNSLRQQLSVAMLVETEHFTLDQVCRCKVNTKMLLADRVKPDLLKTIRGQSVEGVSLDEAIPVLEAWDNTTSAESKGALLFTTFWSKYGDHAVHPYAQDWDNSQPFSTPHGLGEPETARAAMAEAIQEMKKKYGTLALAWGDVHRLRRGNVDVPMGGFISEYRANFRGGRFGDYGSFRVIRYEKDKDGKWVAREGDSFVLAVEFTTPPTAYSISAYSQSDDTRSPHHTDQSRLFARGEWKRVAFTEEEIARNLERTYHP
jgi:acyl-homoserine-lactone acylase